MANIKIELSLPIIDGMPLSFKAPCDCVAVTGIKVEYPEGDSTVSKVFTFADAHGNELTGIGNLFTAGAMVRVILDTDTNKAFLQNADTNAYLEGRFRELDESRAGFSIPEGADLDSIVKPGKYACETDEKASDLIQCPVNKAFTMDVRFADGAGPYVGQEIKPRDTGARLYRQFLGFSDVLGAGWTDNPGSYPIPTGLAEMYTHIKGQKSNASIYKGEDPSTAWYTNGPSKVDGYYHIKTVADLLGVAILVNEGQTTFEGETIVLDNDLVVNQGDAKTWTDDSKDSLYPWTPIGATEAKSFHGTFDGQSHYISGLYSRVDRDNGLFCWSFNATVKNLGIINSYFENFGRWHKNGYMSAQVLTTFVGRGYGATLQNLYSDARLIIPETAVGFNTGGIAGYVKSGGTQNSISYGDGIVDGCMFEGTITTNNTQDKMAGGILGGTDGSYATIQNCLNNSKITTKGTYNGGIIGQINNGSVITCCVSAGIINEAQAGTGGAVVGRLGGAGSFTITRCCYAKDMGLDLYGVKEDSSASVVATGNEAVAAECIANSMIPTEWVRMFDSENGINHKHYHRILTKEMFDAAIEDIWGRLSNACVGHFTFDMADAGAPLFGGLWHLTVYRATNDYGVIKAITYNGSNPAVLYLNRYKTWGEWQWENPPMVLGVEYRTTERYFNKAVYTKLINVGFVYAGANSFAHNLAVITPISIDAVNNSSEVVTTGSNITNLNMGRTHININCAVNHGNLTFRVKYTKE